MRADDFLDQPSAAGFLDGPGGAGSTAPKASWQDDLRDIAAALLKIGPTAVKGVADLARLGTADTIGVDTSKAMTRGMTAIDDVVGSEALRAQKANINRALSSPDVSIGQLPGVILDNPRAAGDAAVSTIGSMFLPIGASAGVTKAMPLIERVLPAAARVAPGTIATGTAIATGAAQNAAETYADTEGRSQGDRYQGAGISAAASLALGKLLGGGAEGLVARRMVGETVAKGVREAGKSVAKTSAKEFLQEAGEESGNYTGKQVAQDKPIDPNAMGKQALYGGVIGLGVGGASDAATNLANLAQGSAESQVARAINEGSQALADAPVPTTVQQTVARIFDTPVSRATAPAPAPAPAPIPALGFDPAVQNPQRPMVADAAGNVRELTADELLAREQDDQRRQELGFTRDIERAAAQRAASEPAAAPSAPSDLIERLMAAGWTPPLNSAEARANPPAAPAPAPAPTPAPASAPAASPVTPEQAAVAAADAMARFGRDGIDLAQGGKPFKTRAAASQARKLQPHLRVVSHPGGGYVLANKTPAQLAAQEKAARRLRQANVGQKGQPLAAHEFIAAEGGLRQDVRSDLGIEGNPRIGNRTLYAAPGKGLTIEQATEKLQEAGYLQSDLHNDAFDLIRRSLTQAPQYTAEGFERQAEAELQAQYEDHLRAQQEAAQQEDFDPFTDLAELGFTEEDGDAAGYWQASPELQAEVRALANRLDDMGGDSESLFEDLVRQYPDLPQQEFYETARQAITDAIAQLEAAQQRGRGDSGQDDGRQARQDSGPDAQDQGLSAEQPAPEGGDGITIIPGKGLIKGKFLVEVDGQGVPGGPFDTEQQARQAALERRKVLAERAKDNERDAQRKRAIADKLRAGDDISNSELDFLGLKPTSDLRWFIPAAADLFGITSRQVRPLIKDLIRPAYSDMGAKYELVQSAPALRAIAAAQPKAADGKSRAVAGGQEGINGYFYKGGQFLPNTQAEPGKWKVNGKWVNAGRALVAPGELAFQPTPFSRSLFELAGVGANVILRDGKMVLNPGANGDGVRAANGEPVTLDMEIRPGVKGVLGKESLTLGDIIEAWNNGQRWFDVKPDAQTVTTQDQDALTSYTPADIEQRITALEQAEKDRQAADREDQRRAQADAERDNFTLTGSDRPADANPGQADIFSESAERQVEQTTTPKVEAKQPLPIPEDDFANVMDRAIRERYYREPAQTARMESLAEREGFITPEQARARVEQWKAAARAQGKSGVNAGKVVLSLFDASGHWSQPWRDAGYEVHQFDLQHGDDINNFSAQYLIDELDLSNVHAILAAPPCTDFSSSGAHAWAKKDADGRTEASIELVRQTLRTIELLKPTVWALENPVGRIQSLASLPIPTLTFQPHNFGDPYTKRTMLWGDFKTELPLANVEPTQGSKMTKLSGTDKYGRSLTPEGFAYAFFAANNLQDMGAGNGLAQEFKGIPEQDIQAALDAGLSESDIRTAIEDDFYDGDIEAATQALRDAMPAAKPAAAPARAASRIEDFGEKIGGARKDAWTGFKDQLGEVSDEQIAAEPLSRVWPQPDYQALLDNGADPLAVAFVRAARDEIPNKPRQSWKVKRWAEQVKTLRTMATDVLNGTDSGRFTLDVLQSDRGALPSAAQHVKGRAALYQAVGHAKSLAGINLAFHNYTLYKGEKNVSLWTVEKEAAATAWSNWPVEIATGKTREEAIEAFKAKYDGLQTGPAKKQGASFDIIADRRTGTLWVGKKIGRNYAKLAGPFKSSSEARAHRDANLAELEDKLAKFKETPFERRDVNEPRVGEDMRAGQDVTPEFFASTFGFRGVEFGNWVEQGRRQKDLNDAFDALMDMAAVLGIPPKAISLNGELGLAFGARGSGGLKPAAAHYERDKVVINLTKKNGAGSLGHEWWHALDNYFSRARKQPSDYMTEASDVGLASRDRQFYYEDRGVRREMVQAFGAVLKAISNSGLKSRAEKLDAKRTKDYWSTDVEMSARAFEAFLINKLQDQNASNDYLANIVSPEAWKAAEKMGMELDDSYPYPTGDELPSVRAAFEQFFQTIEARETENGIALFRAPEQADGDGIQLYAPNGGSASALGKMSLDAVRKAAQTAVKGVPNAPDIEVFADPASAGITVAPGIRPMGGTLPDGRIVLFADHIGSVIGVHQTVFHELFHRGAKVRFRSNPDYIAAMLDLAAGDVTVRRLAATWKKSADGQDKRLMYEKRGPMTGDRLANYEALAVEEALAEIAEGLAARKYKPEPTTIQRIARALARVAEVFGMARLANWLRQADASAAERFVMETLQMSGGTPNKNTTALLLKQGGVQSATQSWNVPEPGAGDAFIRAIQNNKIDVKRVRDAIQATYGRLPDRLDAYLNEELYHGRVAARVEALHRDHVEPILAKIAVAGKNAGITLDDVNLYLHARHAPERNAAMQAINPGMPNNDALSGMSNADAARVMADFQAAGKRQALAAIARDVDQLLADVRTGLVADGLEDASVVQAWEGAYKHYVPLQRDIGQADQRGNGRGMGFSVRGPEAKRAVGSDLKVVDILANIVTQAETAAIRAEKAEVGRTLLRMALAYPNPDFWQVDKVPTKPRIDPATGLVIRNAVDPMYQTADNVVMVKHYGAEHFIVFNRRSERAMAMAHAMKNLDIAQMNKILEVFNKGTRFMASLLTQRNPLFWLTNFARDVQGAMLNLEGTKAEGLQRQVVANLPKAFAGMRSLVRGNASGQWARHARDLQEAGGTTGYMEVFGSSTERMQALEKEVARMQQGKADPRRLARTMLEFIDDYNDIIENTVRLSVFQAARDNGSSTEQAASIAKNITINFNRKGNLSPAVNALYMFFNASVQGTARLMQALATSRKAQAAVGSLVVIGFLLDMVNRAMAGDDEETKRNRYDLIPEFEKSRNWIFMNPARPGEYVKVPLPLGPHIFHNTGRLLSDAINREDARNASEYGWSLAGLFLDAFSPLGGPQSVGQLIAPSVLDPVVQVAENKNFTGAPVYKSADRGFGNTDPKPAYTRHFENTPDLWIGASKMLSDVTGGDKVKPGVINVEPDILKHGFYTLTGGPGRALDQAIDTAQAPARGRELSVNRLPLASRFYGANDDAQRERAYYDDRKRAADAKQQFDYFMKSGRPELAREVVRELGDGDEMAGRKKMATFNAADKSVRAINQQMRRELEQENPDQAERLKALRERRMKVMSNAVNDED